MLRRSNGAYRTGFCWQKGLHKNQTKFSEICYVTPVRRSYAEFDVADDYWQNSALVPAPQLLTSIRSFSYISLHSAVTDQTYCMKYGVQVFIVEKGSSVSSD